MPEPPQQAGENPSSSSSHLVKAQVRIAGACGRPCSHGDTESLLFSHQNCPEPQNSAFWQQHHSLLGCSCPLASLGICRWRGETGGSAPVSVLIHHFCWALSPLIIQLCWILGPFSAQGDLEVEATPTQPLWGLWATAAKNWATETWRGTLDKSMYRQNCDNSLKMKESRS